MLDQIRINRLIEEITENGEIHVWESYNGWYAGLPWANDVLAEGNSSRQVSLKAESILDEMGVSDIKWRYR